MEYKQTAYLSDKKTQGIQLSHVPRPGKPSFSDSDKVNIPDVVAYVAVPDHV